MTRDVKVRQLVLLSCPAHSLYEPDFSNVSDVVSIRVKWDLVIMADRGNQEFEDRRIREHILPFWYGAHDSCRRSSTWRSQDLAKHLQVPGGSTAVATAAAPPPPSPVVPIFKYIVVVKGPFDRAVAFIRAIKAEPQIKYAHVMQAVFKNSAPRPRYEVSVIARHALTDAWIRQVAVRANTEILWTDAETL